MAVRHVRKHGGEVCGLYATYENMVVRFVGCASAARNVPRTRSNVLVWWIRLSCERTALMRGVPPKTIVRKVLAEIVTVQCLEMRVSSCPRCGFEQHTSCV